MHHAPHIVSTWSCVKTDAASGQFRPEPSALMTLMSLCIPLFHESVSYLVTYAEIRCHKFREKRWWIPLVFMIMTGDRKTLLKAVLWLVLIKLQWTLTVTHHSDHDADIWRPPLDSGYHYDIKFAFLQNESVISLVLLFVLMFCNVSDNDVWALHYIKQLGLARDGGGAFPPSSQPSSGQSGAGLRDSDQWGAGTGSGGRSRSWVRPAQLECGQRTLYSLSSQSVVVCLLRDD